MSDSATTKKATLTTKTNAFLYTINCVNDNVSHWCHPQRWMGTETLNHSAQCVCKHGAQFSWVAVDGVNLRPPVQVWLARTQKWNINKQQTTKLLHSYSITKERVTGSGHKMHFIWTIINTHAECWHFWRSSICIIGVSFKVEFNLHNLKI